MSTLSELQYEECALIHAHVFVGLLTLFEFRRLNCLWYEPMRYAAFFFFFSFSFSFCRIYVVMGGSSIVLCNPLNKNFTPILEVFE